MYQSKEYTSFEVVSNAVLATFTTDLQLKLKEGYVPISPLKNITMAAGKYEVFLGKPRTSSLRYRDAQVIEGNAATCKSALNTLAATKRFDIWAVGSDQGRDGMTFLVGIK